MEIRKVKWDGQKMTITWDSGDGERTSISHTLTSDERPSPEFVEAMRDVVAPAARLLELGEGSRERMTFRSATASLDDQGRRGMTVCVLREIAGASAPVVENTPYLPEADAEDPNPCLPTDLEGAVDDVMAFAVRFVRGGEREQADMFEAELAEELEDRGLVATR